jgi:hypothetical protein
MIYFTFFHSLFWLNTIKERDRQREREREREQLQFLFFSGPRHSIMQKSCTTYVPRQKKLAELASFLSCLPLLSRKDKELKTQKEATGYTA